MIFWKRKTADERGDALEKVELGVLLTKLGRTEAEVAARLRRGNFTGFPKAAHSCPIANYLRVVGDYRTVTVSKNLVIVGVRQVSADTPEVVEQFITNFDRGKYPELIAA